MRVQVVWAGAVADCMQIEPRGVHLGASGWSPSGTPATHHPSILPSLFSCIRMISEFT